MNRKLCVAVVTILTSLALGSCGGGGGGDAAGLDPGVETKGVFTGYSDQGNLDWENPGGDGSEGGFGNGEGSGVGSGSDGAGGVGVGGDQGQFRGANVCVFLDDGSQLGCALTDQTKGMVTVRPGRDYTGGLRIEMTGNATATYYEEGRDTYVPFPAGQTLRTWVAAIGRNIGITPFSEAAYSLLTEGSAPESVGTARRPTRAEIRAANQRVRLALNEHFPTALQVDDITRLPFIKSQGLAKGSMKTDPRGRYGLVNGAFSKQASFHNSDAAAPTLDAVKQLSADLKDGRIDGNNGAQLAGQAQSRTYDPNTLTSELSSALAEQAARFGSQEALDVLPKVVNFGNVRYEGYLFDGSIAKFGTANSTVAGWVSENTKGFTLGLQFDRLPNQRALNLFANNGHGGGFYKADANGARHKVYAIGDNVNGELGLGRVGSTEAKAEEVTLPGSPSHIVGGFAHTVARMADGTVWTWGDNNYGQLGQNNPAMTNSLVPVQVNLPVRAVAVAAASVASYALGADGRVYTWGSNGGFGLLGNGAADGVSQIPAAVGGLTEVVQISARDNDVVVLRRDNTVWHWGSHPAEESAFVSGDPTVAYSGGRRSPTQVAGLPAGQSVRKVITEQGLFAALLSNGHVYTWGVHFDITAGQILRGPSQMNATRMLGLPPIRDMMPGGFQGYGQRAFDRLTAMGVDYDGGMWKIRGRVGEFYDPETEATRSAVRRPQGQGPRVDCEACHTFLDQTLGALKAASKQPTAGTACLPPPSAHMGLSASLIHSETDCVACHNPSRLNYPISTPSGVQPFASNGGWASCVKPTNLLPRSAPATEIISNACEPPARHVFTPPGTVCASCHNSVLARPLSQLGTKCAQPDSKALPTIATTAAITGAVTGGSIPIAAGSLTSAPGHTLLGTVTSSLAIGQTVSIERAGIEVGNAAVAGTSWTFNVPNAPQGINGYRVRVKNATGGFSAYSAVYSFSVDSAAPAVTSSVIGFTDNNLGVPISIGAVTFDTTPTVRGNLSAPLGIVNLARGDLVQVFRGGLLIGNATVSGTDWTFSESTPLPAGRYSYSSRVVDAAGNGGAVSSGATITVSVAAPSATLSVPLAITTPSNGLFVNTATPALSGTISANLPTGGIVRVYRGTAVGACASVSSLGTASCASAGQATVSGTSWTFTDLNVGQGLRAYRARVEVGTVAGPLSGTVDGVVVTVDSVSPTQTLTVAAVTTSVMPNSLVANASQVGTGIVAGAITNDLTPTFRILLSAPLASGESLRISRNGAVQTPVSIAACGGSPPPPNCYLLTPPAPAGISLSNNESTFSTATPSLGGLPTTAQSFTFGVVDLAGNLGPPSTAFSLRYGYLTCDQVRANATYTALNPGFTHSPFGDPNVTSGASKGLYCAGCHSSSYTVSPVVSTSTTPRDALVAVPSSTPSYWCLRP